LQHLPKWNRYFLSFFVAYLQKTIAVFYAPAFGRPGVSPKAAEIPHRETRWIDQTMPISD
jgi:hypothetical protein